MQSKLLILFLTGLAIAPAYGQVNILTNLDDNSRTGANLNETTLQVSNVNVNQFGKLYAYPVDGGIQAQPLYVAGVNINGTTYNVLYVATLNDKVYAFDADHNAPPLWTRDFTNPPAVTPIPLVDIEGAGESGGDLPNIGIRSTPVIDANAGTMYLLAHTKENGTYVQRLHALDITTGLERKGSPVAITASAAGTAPDAVNGMVTFDPKMQNQRAGLALTNGVVVIAWASHDDTLPYHGWIMGYDATTLAQVGVLCVSPDYYYGGIWQSGRAPAIDSSGNVYFEVGNAIWDGARNWGDSVLKLGVSTSGLSLLDWFTPSDWSYLSTSDFDLGSTGAILLPNTNTLVAGGKESIFYLLNANKLGNETANDSQTIQKFSVNGGSFMGGPIYWNSATAGPLLYNWAEGDALHAYHFNGTTLDSGSYAQGSVVSPGHPGGILSLSANGNKSGTGIVWASIPTSQNSNVGFVAGILRAYQAETLQEIWNSEQNSTRDRLGTYMRFVPPVVDNGKVYMPNYDNAVVVYGLLPAAADFTIAASPSTRSVPTGGGATSYTVSIGATNGFSGSVNLSVSGNPTGVTATLNPASVSGSGTSTLQITVGAGAVTGNYTLTITGTSGVLSHLTSVSLSITAASSVLADAQVSMDGIQPASSITSPTFSTASGNELLLAFVSTDFGFGANTTVTGVTGAGLTWALVQRTDVQSGTAEIWRAFSISPLNGVTVTATLSQSVYSSLTVMSFSGVDASGTNGSGAIGATGSGNARSGAPAATLVTTRASSFVIGVGNDYDNAIARTPAAGQLIVHQDLAPVGDTYWVQMVKGGIPASGTSVTLNDTAPTNDRFNFSIVEVLPTPAPEPSLTVTKSHSGSFRQGQTGALYTITVINGGSASTSGMVTVTDMLPAGLSAAAMSGTGWTCALGTLTCTRNDALSAGSSYPSITLTVNVLSNAPASVTNSVTVSGGNSSNNAANDVTVINPTPASIVATAGTPQSATINTLFVTPLKATVKDAGNSPVSGVSVTFSAPGSGASGTFSGSSTVTTDASGVATAPAFTANSTAGSYIVTASTAGVSTPASFSLTNTAAPPPTLIAVDVRTSTDRSTAGTTISSPAFTTASGNELLLAFVSTDGPLSGLVSVSSVSGGGLVWNLVVRTNIQSGTAEIWRAFGPTTLSNVTVTATLSQGVAASMTVMSFTGVNTSGTNGSGAIGAVGSGNANPGAPAASLVTMKNNSLVIGVGNDWDNAISRTVSPNQTLVHQYLATVGDTYWVQMVTMSSPAGTTVTVNDTAPATDRYNLSICEIVGP